MPPTSTTALGGGNEPRPSSMGVFSGPNVNVGKSLGARGGGASSSGSEPSSNPGRLFLPSNPSRGLRCAMGMLDAGALAADSRIAASVAVASPASSSG
jgi:hypothetical protein